MIQIQEPELEALIAERMKAGAFETIEQTLLQALKEAPLPVNIPAKDTRTGRDLIEAFRRSPLYGLDIDFEAHRRPMPVREFEFELE